MFPYEKYRNSELWNKIDEIVSELEENEDLELTTAREYVIGFSVLD
ncbi:MAG: hypothetical protein WAU71_08035 [Pyrinomonadaceae bacterium]